MARITLIGLLLATLVCGVLFLFGGLMSAQGGVDLVATFGPEPQTLDPGTMSGINESRYGYALFEGLITYAEDGLTPIPGVAESWTVSPDQTVYTFKLRKTNWSNGEPLTAHDFVWSWLRANDPSTGSDYAAMIWYVKNALAWHLWKAAALSIRFFLRGDEMDDESRAKNLEALVAGAREDQIADLQRIPVKTAERKQLDKAVAEAGKRKRIADADVGVRAIDDGTLEVTLEAPTPFMLDIFGFHTYMPVNRKCLETHGDGWLMPRNFVGNGPFVIEEWRPQYRIVLKKNPHYHDLAHVRSNRIVLLIMDAANTAMNYYETGAVDFLDRIQIPSDFLELLSQRPDFHRYAAFGDYFLRFNVTKPPFNDVRVRKAFTHAIDRRIITDKILKGGEFPYNVLTPPFPGYDPGTKGCPYDEALARKYMDEAYPDRSQFPAIEFLTRNSKKGLDLYSHLKEQWERVLGVSVGVKAQEWSVYLTSMSNLDYHVSYGGWQGDYLDPHTFIDIWITGGGNNRTGWSDPEFDKWVEEALREPDQAKRFKLYQRCEKRVVEEACIIAPMYVTAERVMYKPHLKGIKTNPMDRFLLKYWYAER